MTRRIRGAAWAALLSWMSVGSLAAWADEAPTTPAADGLTGWFSLPSPFSSVDEKSWTFGWTLDERTRRTATDHPVELRQHRLAVSRGICDHFEVAISMPHVLLTSSAPAVPTRYLGRLFTERLRSGGRGDVRLAAKRRFDADPDRPGVHAVDAFVDLIPGDHEADVVTGDVGFGVGWTWGRASDDQQHQLVRLALAHHGRADGAEHRAVTAIAALGWAQRVPKNPRWRWLNELVLDQPLRGGTGLPRSSLDFTTGLRYHAAATRWRATAGLRVDLLERDSVSLVVGLAIYRPARKNETVTIRTVTTRRH